MEPMDALEAVQLYEDVKTEVVESCYTLHELPSPKKRKSRAQEDMHDKPKKPRYSLYDCIIIHFFYILHSNTVSVRCTVACNVTRVSLFRMALCYEEHGRIKHFD